ncbi:hypothetical protein ZEAMMB73_Zm00001d050877 [Zea mays]|uniref:Replication factor A C-terminal domain-containing protein n=1 Tax=Zea mays TaxID=4577 RepID=A0A1D6Q3Q2_MAIZE|nr:hypothetical protein ZEAMMB73_Zm00001d050877 [Zea mays]
MQAVFLSPDLVLLEPGPETGHGALVGVPREDGVAAVAPGVFDELEDDLRLRDGPALVDQHGDFLLHGVVRQQLGALAPEILLHCEGCQKNDSECSLRYIMVIKVSDPTGEAWVSVFNEHAEKIISCNADELDRIRKEEGDDNYVLKLKEVT